MAQRVEPHDSLDDFPTPPWATRALCEYVLPDDIGDDDCDEPAANRGFLVRGLQDYFGEVAGSDIHDYGAGFDVEDYLLLRSQRKKRAWSITNPPFVLAEEFLLRMLELSTRGVALFVRSTFAEGQGRYRNVFSVTPPTVIVYFAERPVLVKGRLLDPDVKIKSWDKKKQEWKWKKTSNATAYAWFVWIHGEAPRPPMWIPPEARGKLTRPGDYVYPDGVV